MKKFKELVNEIRKFKLPRGEQEIDSYMEKGAKGKKVPVVIAKKSNKYKVYVDGQELAVYNNEKLARKNAKELIKLLGEDRIINYFWKWYKKSEDKDEPWKNINKIQNLDVYDKVILKYPPEIKKLEIANNIDIIRKTFVRFAAPLIFFMLII